MNRRNLLRSLGAIGVVAPLAENGLAAGLGSTPLPDDKENIFRSIGVEPIINCRGTFTIIGGSIELPQVRAAMEAASQIGRAHV